MIGCDLMYFEFVKEFSESVYEECLVAEKNVKINPELCIAKVRTAIEAFCLYKLSRDKKKYLSKNDEFIKLKTMIMQLAEEGKISKYARDIFNFLRINCNSSHHADADSVVNNSFKELIHVPEARLYLFMLNQILFECFYNPRINKDFLMKKQLISMNVKNPLTKEDKTPEELITEYDLEDVLLPIGKYIPIEELPIKDYELCDKKYLCKLEEFDETYYAIVKQFRNSDSNLNSRGKEYGDAKDLKDITSFLFSREMNSLFKRWRGVKPSPQHIIQFDNIDISEKNDLFFTCYIIDEDTVTLDEEDLNKYDNKTKLKIFVDIARGLEELKGRIRFHHRFIRPESIFLSRDEAGNISVVLGNFEFSKAINNMEVKNQITASELTRLQQIQIKDSFIAPEYSNLIEYSDYDMGKADIYSLGKLGLYIFNIETGLLKNPQELKRAGITENIAKLLESLTSVNVNERLPLEEIIKTIEEELKK